jgi:hypothetical protein
VAELLLFIVPQRGEPEIETQNLVTSVREALSVRLPAYMQPRRVHVVRELPLTPNGKLDEIALLALAPAAEADPSTTDSTDASEPTSLERLWSSLLNTPATTDSDFFLAGGDSFLAVRLMKELSADAGRRVPIRLLFANPVLADFRRELARYLAASQN